jgi:hypothetical protein
MCRGCPVGSSRFAIPAWLRTSRGDLPRGPLFQRGDSPGTKELSDQRPTKGYVIGSSRLDGARKGRLLGKRSNVRPTLARFSTDLIRSTGTAIPILWIALLTVVSGDIGHPTDRHLVAAVAGAVTAVARRHELRRLWRLSSSEDSHALRRQLIQIRERLTSRSTQVGWVDDVLGDVLHPCLDVSGQLAP